MRVAKEETGDRGWCLNCEEWVYTVYHDDGIGPYEYQGHIEIHHAWITVCPWCGEDNLTDYPEDLEE